VLNGESCSSTVLELDLDLERELSQLIELAIKNAGDLHGEEETGE
jgi:hypothetical protein